MKITKKDIEKIAADPEAVKLFYESDGAFVVYEDGTYGIEKDHKSRDDIVAMVICPYPKLRDSLVCSFMDETVVI